jgi:hypothetical protein
MTLDDVVTAINHSSDLQSAYMGILCAFIAVLIFAVAWGTHHV